MSPVGLKLTLFTTGTCPSFSLLTEMGLIAVAGTIVPVKPQVWESRRQPGETMYQGLHDWVRQFGANNLDRTSNTIFCANCPTDF
jgi:hypothetical protein